MPLKLYRQRPLPMRPDHTAEPTGVARAPLRLGGGLRGRPMGPDVAVIRPAQSAAWSISMAASRRMALHRRGAGPGRPAGTTDYRRAVRVGARSSDRFGDT